MKMKRKKNSNNKYSINSSNRVRRPRPAERREATNNNSNKKTVAMAITTKNVQCYSIRKHVNVICEKKKTKILNYCAGNLISVSECFVRNRKYVRMCERAYTRLALKTVYENHLRWCRPGVLAVKTKTKHRK